MYFVTLYIDFSEMETMHSARNKDQELVGRFLNIEYFYRLLIIVPLKMYRKYGNY